MFVDYTFQDWQEADNKGKMLLNIVNRYKTSAEFFNGLDAIQYFNGENPTVAKKTILKADCTQTKDETTGRITKRWINKDVVGNRVGSSFFFRFVTQENQHLLSNGVTLSDEETKAKLGLGFDKALEAIGEKALISGVCWGFWNVDHIEVIPAVSDSLSGAVALLDEVTGVPMVLVQFWQIKEDKTLTVRLFETDGVSMWQKNKGQFICTEDKKPYVNRVTVDALGEIAIGSSNYGNVLPVIPFYANAERKSELTPSIRAKIDLYDKVFSDFGDNLDRANDVYWVLNNFGGSESDIATMIEQINRIKAVVNVSDGTGSGSTAEPRTLEVPYAARQTALQLLKKNLYQDYMALDMDQITGGSLTNVAIKAAMANIDSKCDRYEWQAFQFVQSVLKLIGVETERISFVRNSIVNEQEVIANIYTMRSDIDQRTALKLNPYINQEDIEEIISNVQAESASGLPSVEELQQVLDEDEEV